MANVMALSTVAAKDPIKTFNKKSKSIFKKNNKNNNVKNLKEKITHCNPKALMTEKESGTGVKSKKFKKKKKGKKKSNQSDMQSGEIENVQKDENKLEELKSSTSSISSNWKSLMNNLSKEEQEDNVPRPAFIRRNKKGQIITNQQMNHPKAVVIGNKTKEKKSKDVAKIDKTADDKDDVWFDDVDPMLLDSALKSGDPEEALVKSNSFKGVTKILGMDCEMVGVGAEGSDSILARVSIVNHFGNVLYDKFVAPREKVTDYRTEVSGVRPEDLIGAPDFKTVQSEVSELIKGRILVGHAIHHDLKVLYLDHPRKLIRDTSKYKPFKAAFGGRTPGLDCNFKQLKLYMLTSQD